MLLVAACTDKQTDGNTVSGLNPADFRMEVDGKQTYLFVLKNTNGMEVCITNFGGRIVSIMVPDKEGIMRDVVLGFYSVYENVVRIFYPPFSCFTTIRATPTAIYLGHYAINI